VYVCVLGLIIIYVKSVGVVKNTIKNFGLKNLHLLSTFIDYFSSFVFYPCRLFSLIVIKRCYIYIHLPCFTEYILVPTSYGSSNCDKNIILHNEHQAGKLIVLKE